MSWFDNDLIAEVRTSPMTTYRYLSETRRRFFVGDYEAMASGKPLVGDVIDDLTVIEVTLQPTGKNGMGEGSLLMAAEAVVAIETDSRPFEISVFRHPKYTSLELKYKSWVAAFEGAQAYEGVLLRWAVAYEQWGWPELAIDLLKRVINHQMTYTVWAPIIRRTTTIPYSPTGQFPTVDGSNTTIAAGNLPISPYGAGAWWWTKIPDKITRVGLSWTRIETWISEPAVPGLTRLSGSTVGTW